MYPLINFDPTNIILALGSTGAFVALYKIVIAYLERHKHREMTVKYREFEITFKGHTPEDESVIIKQLSMKTFTQITNSGKKLLKPKKD
jgi:hypothetical protein